MSAQLDLEMPECFVNESLSDDQWDQIEKVILDDEHGYLKIAETCPFYTFELPDEIKETDERKRELIRKLIKMSIGENISFQKKSRLVSYEEFMDHKCS